MEKSSNRFRGLQRRNGIRIHATQAQHQHSESQRYYELSSPSFCADSDSRVMDTTEDASTSMIHDAKPETNFIDRCLMDKRFKRRAVWDQLNRKFVDYEHIRSNCLDYESFIENQDEFMDHLDEFKRIAKQRRERVKDSAESVHMDAQSVNVTKNICREESSKSTSSRVRRTDTFNKQKDGEDITDYIKRIFTKSSDLDEDDYMESFMNMC